MDGLQAKGDMQPEIDGSEPPGQIAEPVIPILVAESVDISLAGRCEMPTNRIALAQHNAARGKS